MARQLCQGPPESIGLFRHAANRPGTFPPVEEHCACTPRPSPDAGNEGETGIPAGGGSGPAHLPITQYARGLVSLSDHGWEPTAAVPPYRSLGGACPSYCDMNSATRAVTSSQNGIPLPASANVESSRLRSVGTTSQDHRSQNRRRRQSGPAHDSLLYLRHVHSGEA